MKLATSRNYVILSRGDDAIRATSTWDFSNKPLITIFFGIGFGKPGIPALDPGNLRVPRFFLRRWRVFENDNNGSPVAGKRGPQKNPGAPLGPPVGRRPNTPPLGSPIPPPLPPIRCRPNTPPFGFGFAPVHATRRSLGPVEGSLAWPRTPLSRGGPRVPPLASDSL